MTIDEIIDELIYLYENSEQAETSSFHDWYFREALPSYGNAAQFKRAKQMYRHFLPQYYRVKIGLIKYDCCQTMDGDDWLDYKGECEKCHAQALGHYHEYMTIHYKYHRVNISLNGNLEL